MKSSFVTSNRDRIALIAVKSIMPYLTYDMEGGDFQKELGPEVYYSLALHYT